MALFKVLPGLPSTGPIPSAFGIPAYREGYVVEFYSPPGSWIGNFGPGHEGWNGVILHPDGRHLIVVARGDGYLVDPETRDVASIFSCVQQIIHLQEFGALLFCNGLHFEALRKDGLWWRSPRVSWDGIRNIRIEGAVLRGEAFDPTAGENAWSDFTLDLMTGTCPDSRYREQMSRAIPVRPVET